MPVKVVNGEQNTLAEDAVSAKSAFQAKARRTDTLKIKLNDEEVEVSVKALPAKELRELVAHHPARKNNPEDQLGFNYETFPPALFAKVYTSPEMSEDEWSDIWVSPDWSPGELSHLLDIAWGICNRGFDVPFIARS